MALFKERFRVDTTRLHEWDYSRSAWYFVTLCVHRHEMAFGEVANGVMNHSTIGEIARRYIESIPSHHTDVSIDEFQIMPNHLHGIIIIDHPLETLQRIVSAHRQRQEETLQCNISTKPAGNRMSTISPKPGSLSTIIRSYKSAVTYWCHHNGYDSFRWQERYHDHIIRNEAALQRIRQYIHDNPMKWELDRYYPTQLPGVL